jgi:hypothetical protein
VAFGEKKPDTVWEENALLHRKALLVVAAGYTEDVSFPFVAKRVGWDLLRDLLIVKDSAG